jgi:hypothetical protein
VSRISLERFGPAHDRLSFSIAQVTYSLLGDEVKLDPVPFGFRIDETEGVATEAMHMALGEGNPKVTHEDCDMA